MSEPPRGPGAGQSTMNNPVPYSPVTMPNDMRRRSLQIASQFYQADSQLSRQDRHKLSNAFWYQTVVVPFLGLPVIYGCIMLPNYLKRGGLLNPKKTYRGSQVLLGFFGVFAGQAFAKTSGFAYYQSKLSSEKNQSDAWNVLGRFDPHIGLRYYTVTAARPQLAMPNPSKIDWSKEMGFPLNLVFNKRYTEEAIHEMHEIQDKVESQQEQWNNSRYGTKKPTAGQPGSAEGPTREKDESDDSFAQNPSAPIDPLDAPAGNSDAVPSPATSSWDRVRRTNGSASGSRDIGTPSVSANSGPSSGWGWGWGSGGSKAPPAPGSPDQMAAKQSEFDSMIDKARGGTYDIDVGTEQSKFDELLDKERDGGALKDDFSASEKKW